MTDTLDKAVFALNVALDYAFSNQQKLDYIKAFAIQQRNAALEEAANLFDGRLPLTESGKPMQAIRSLIQREG